MGVMKYICVKIYPIDANLRGHGSMWKYRAVAYRYIYSPKFLKKSRKELITDKVINLVI